MLQNYANEIEKSKHILLQTPAQNFANAAALYSYLLTLHKKVSLYVTDEVDQNFAFLPWYDKIRYTKPSSADLLIDVSSDTLAYYEFFRSNAININAKMATALYSALYEGSEYFASAASAGMLFATVSKLIERGADYRAAEQSLYRSDPLSLFRIKAVLYKSLLLVDNARVAELFISDADLKASGATMHEVQKAMQEVLRVAHVKRVVLKKSDENMKVIKEIEIVK